MTQPHPNVLVVLTDDQGPWAMSRTCPELVTPVLDDLVSRSTSFENYYCASPVCSPSRASLLTGRMPSAHGVHDWLVGERHPDAHEDDYLGGLTTLPQALEEAGYVCAMVGKWHVGSSKRPAPGFSYWYAHRLGGGPYYGAPVWTRDGRRAEEGRYLTDAIAEEACAFLRQATGGPAGAQDATTRSPFYLQVCFTAPHSPWVDAHPRELTDLYADCDFPSVPREERHPWARALDDFDDAWADPLPSLRGYAASLSGVDRALGAIFDELRECGAEQDTIIVYMSDNGFSTGHHGVWGKGNGTWPLNFWESSVRVPFLVHLPGQTQARRVTAHASACTFLETVCELAGVSAPEDPLRVAGSVAGLVTGQVPDTPEASVVVYDEYGGGRMIRDGDLKLIERHVGPTELYDLAQDPQERENLASLPAYATVVSDLHAALEDWFAAHENAVDRAWERDVRGRGQVHPPRRGYDDARTYVPGGPSLDGIQAGGDDAGEDAGDDAS
ncbi:sulfatase-like hydrolase/transferase [Actinomyces sp. HMT897]|uniref:sulfatase-like hydrolase/transferase n=1 Tax=Actinomyces sp. HMT897 TaxID=2789424 RepID=UPI00190B487C|nr:sulfatase-like hydrolase/transferase [Actinomyces sp. HMT897]QQO78197.1 sulfatase-like hydrolase/transferase [Actinomyces sp. HMT897]